MFSIRDWLIIPSELVYLLIELPGQILLTQSTQEAENGSCFSTVGFFLHNGALGRVFGWELQAHDTSQTLPFEQQLECLVDF
jgi:hypothetical protein